MINIGSIYWSKIPYYDKGNHHMSFKLRPMLVIGQSDDKEFNVIPISRCEKTEYIDEKYDILIKLKKESYIRVHKQTVVHIAKIEDEIINLKEKMNSVYEMVLIKLSK